MVDDQNTDVLTGGDKPHQAMRIKSIKIQNYRSYQEAELDCASFNILVRQPNQSNQDAKE